VKQTRRVQICPPDNCLDDPRFGDALDYDQREGILVNYGGTLVQIDGETLSFPRAWIKHLPPS